jgi:uncharacterized membrane protein
MLGEPGARQDVEPPRLGSSNGACTAARNESCFDSLVIGTVIDKWHVWCKSDAAMASSYALLLAFLIGLFAGLRSLTPPAVTAWAARLGWLKLGRGLTWLGTTPAAVIFAVLAIVELVNDKLPKTPSRTAPAGLIARIVTGGFTGACVATAGDQGLALGAILGIAGALVGTFGGYQLRTRLVKALGAPDFVIAVLEDLVAIGGSLWVVSRF